jgi:hypothetical protein
VQKIKKMALISLLGNVMAKILDINDIENSSGQRRWRTPKNFDIFLSNVMILIILSF